MGQIKPSPLSHFKIRGYGYAGVVSESQIRVPRSYRVFERALVAGVAAGLGAQSRVSVWVIRIGVILTSVWKFSGAIAYLALWLILPRYEQRLPIGLVAAQRQGLRSVEHTSGWRQVIVWIVCLPLGELVAYLMSLYDTSWLGSYSTYLCALGWGIGLVWLTRELAWPRGGKIALGAGGVLLAGMAGSFGLVQAMSQIWPESVFDTVNNYVGALIIGGAAIISCGAITLPWLIQPTRSIEQRQTELIAETRADMAAHLHDSVLQTLAVIQKQSGDSRAVAQLARRQERELREWLYGEHLDEESSTTALKDVIAELDAIYPVAVELVTVGDYEMTVEIDALVRAAREAILNAAKHSGADKIDVYAEITAGQAEAYIRDRGKGFEIADIGDDRMGIRRSIIERMERFGGKVDIRSTPGEGTEIHLLMPLNEESKHD